MESNFPTVRVADLIQRGDAILQTGPFGSQLHKSDYVESGTPIIPTEAIGRGRISNGRVLPQLGDEKAGELNRHRLRVGDILFARRGVQATGLSALIEGSHVGSICGTGAILLRLNESVLDPRFVASYLATDQVYEWLRSHATGAVMPNLNTDIISKLRIPVPHIEVQKCIAAVEEAFTSKISNDRALAANLESIARAIFQSWFVDFDPVRAKMDGQEPEGMDPEIAALFPDRLVESELGLVPEGWGWVPLSDMAEFLNGLALQKFPPNGDDDLPVLKIAQLRSGVLDADKLASREVGERYIVTSGDLIFSWSGSLMVDVWSGPDCALNQHLFKVNPAPWATKGLLWAAIQKHIEGFQAIAASKAVTMGHINRRHLDEAFVALPSRESVKAMTTVLDALTERIICARVESAHLSSARDALLPRLISGKLRVTETKAFIGESAA